MTIEQAKRIRDLLLTIENAETSLAELTIQQDNPYVSMDFADIKAIDDTSEIGGNYWSLPAPRDIVIEMICWVRDRARQEIASIPPES